MAEPPKTKENKQQQKKHTQKLETSGYFSESPVLSMESPKNVFSQSYNCSIL